jgi:L-asparaginase
MGIALVATLATAGLGTAIFAQTQTTAPDPAKPMTTEPATPMTPDSDKPMTTDSDKPMSPDSDKPMTPDSDKPMTPDSDKPMTTDTDKPMAPQSAQPTAPASAKTTADKTAKPEKAPTANIKILATGGTIAGAGEAGGYGYTSGQLKIDDLIKAAPGLDKLAKRANALLADPKVARIVITHGTDTMEETAYFLDLTIKSKKPVVLVGSMRPATAISADGPANLYNGVAIAADPAAKGRGVLVVVNDEIHSARNVVKTNTTNLQTFSSPSRGAAGFVNSGKINWFEPMDKRHTMDSEFSVKGLTELPRVDIVYAYANMDATEIKAALDAGAKGIVVAGVGDGNMTKTALDALAAAAKNGTLVIRSTRLPTGMVMRNAEVNDDELGFVASGELNPGKSRVLAQLALTKTNDPKRVQQMFNQY